MTVEQLNMLKEFYQSRPSKTVIELHSITSRPFYVRHVDSVLFSLYIFDINIVIYLYQNACSRTHYAC